MTTAVTSGIFTGTGAGNSMILHGDFNVSLSGFGTATVQLQRSFDGGVVWKTIDSYTSDIEKRGSEIEGGVRYRFNCITYTSGTIVYRLSQ